MLNSTSNELRQRLRNEIRSLSKRKDYTKIKVDHGSLVAELAILHSYSITVNQGLSHSDEEIQKLAKEMLTKVQKRQNETLPILRKKHVKMIADLFKRQEIYIDVSGERSEEMNFTGALLLSKEVIYTLQDQSLKSLNIYRFKRTTYRASKNREPKCFDVATASDDVLFTEAELQ